MIVGGGTDIVAVERMHGLQQKHGERGVAKILAPAERGDCAASAHPWRFLAKRFAAKEALGKALGCGIRAPLVLPAIEVTHDEMGRPGFRLDAAADVLLGAKGLVAHLSISDEADYALAFVVVERR